MLRAAPLPSIPSDFSGRSALAASLKSIADLAERQGGYHPIMPGALPLNTPRLLTFRILQSKVVSMPRVYLSCKIHGLRRAADAAIPLSRKVTMELLILCRLRHSSSTETPFSWTKPLNYLSSTGRPFWWTDKKRETKIKAGIESKGSFPALINI